MNKRGRVNEKSKDFGSAMKRLFSEIKSFRIAILIALILAIVSSILSIMSPNKLSDLTDEISKGLIVNTKNMEKLSTSIYNNLSNIDMNSIVTSSEIGNEVKLEIGNLFKNVDSSDKKAIIEGLSNLSNDSLNAIISEIEINKIKISAKDQVKYLEIASSMDKDASSEDLYKKMDKMPKSIRKLIEPKMNMNNIKKIVILLVIMYVCSALFNYIGSLIMSTVSNNFAKKLRTRISKKINMLPLRYFDNNQTGDILSRVTNDVDTIAQTMNQSLATLVSAVTLFVGTIIMMFVTNYIMAITAILASFIGFIFMFIVLGKSQKYFTARQEELGKLNSHIEEVYSGLLVVKAYNGKKESDDKFDMLNDRVYNANRRSQFLSGLMHPVMGFIGNFGYVCVCIVGAILTSKEIITFGVIVAFIVYVRLFTSPLSQIAQAMNSLQSTGAASERVFEFLDEEEMDNQDNIVKYLDKDKAKGNIEFCHVKFGYNEDRVIIKDFSAKVKSGQKIAIVGPTGAGKTTMVNLLMKFYDINSGDIKIDGISTKDLSRENIHKLFTMVLQDTWLFNGTIRENIVYNRENISDDKVMEVCEIVGLSHFIKTLPKGLDTVLSENDSVSAGQKQLLTIARGMIEDAPFLILDEATSNVDTRTEELVQKAMDKLTEGKTSFIIAHRLSTVINSDKIILIEDGKNIAEGTHEELLKKNKYYKNLYNLELKNR